MEQGAKKIGTKSLIAVFISYACSVTAISNGANVGKGATFIHGVIGLVIAFVLATVVSAIISNIGFKMGVTKDIAWKTLFGRKGFLLCSLFVALCLSFWACYDIFNAGEALYNLMPDGTFLKNFGFTLGIVLVLVITIVGGIVGIQGLKWIANLSIPVAMVLFIIIYVVSFREAGGMSGVLAYVPEHESLGILGSAQLAFAHWMAGYIGLMDLTPEAKSTKSIVAASVCFGAFVSLTFFVGQIGFIGTGMMTFGNACMSIGGAVFIIGNIFVLIAQGNTTPACNFFYSNSYATAFRLPRKPLAIIVPSIAAAVAFVIMYGSGIDKISVVANIVGILAGPIIGCTLAEFYVVGKGKIKAVEDEAQLPVIRWTPFLIIIVGAVGGYFLVNFTPLPIPSLWIIVLTFAVDALLRVKFKTK